MTIETEIYLKMLLVFLSSGFIFYLMSRSQKRKEQEAEDKFQETLKLIELRNKKYEPKGKER